MEFLINMENWHHSEISELKESKKIYKEYLNNNNINIKQKKEYGNLINKIDKEIKRISKIYEKEYRQTQRNLDLFVKKFNDEYSGMEMTLDELDDVCRAEIACLMNRDRGTIDSCFCDNMAEYLVEGYSCTYMNTFDIEWKYLDDEVFKIYKEFQNNEIEEDEVIDFIRDTTIEVYGIELL